MAATVTSKGRVTIPLCVRKRLGVHPGSRISFEELPDGRIAIAPLAKFTIDEFIGCLPAPTSARPLEDMHRTPKIAVRKKRIVGRDDEVERCRRP